MQSLTINQEVVMKLATYLSIIAAVTLASFLASCRDDATMPVGVSSNNSSLEGALKPMQGNGTGRVTINPLDGTTGFSARISVEVVGAMPNSLFHVQEAPEVSRPLCDDGIGQRAAGMWPWQQPSSSGFSAAQAFLALPAAGSGSLATISTDDQGNGNAEFMFNDPTIPVGSHDVVFRILRDSNLPALPDTALWEQTKELRTDCFTLQAK